MAFLSKSLAGEAVAAAVRTEAHRFEALLAAELALEKVADLRNSDSKIARRLTKLSNRLSDLAREAAALENRLGVR